MVYGAMVFNATFNTISEVSWLSVGNRIQHYNKTDTQLCFQTFLKFLFLIISIVVLIQRRFLTLPSYTIEI
jgi:hypothetical protein